MLQKRYNCHKPNHSDDSLKEKLLIGFEIGGDLEKSGEKYDPNEAIKDGIQSLQEDNETTEDNVSIRKAIMEHLTDEKDLDERTAKIITNYLIYKLKSQPDYSNKTQKDRDVVVSTREDGTFEVSVHEESSWGDLEPYYEKTYFTGSVKLNNEAIAEAIEKFSPNKEVAATKLGAEHERMKLVESTAAKTKPWYRESDLFETEQIIHELEKDSVSEDYYDVPEEFTAKFDDDDEAREAFLTGQIENHQNIVKLIGNLGINQKVLFEETFGSWGYLEQGIGADKLFELSNLNYESIEDAEDQMKILAKNPKDNLKELNTITRGLRDIRALGQELSRLEYREVRTTHPDYISDIKFGRGSAELKETFEDNPEQLVAIMGYYYGLNKMEADGMVKYKVDKDNHEFDLYIQKVPEKDIALFQKAYNQIDSFNWSFGDKSVTEGIAVLSDPEFAEARKILDAAKIDHLNSNPDLGSTEYVKTRAALIANPLNSGPITEAGETLTTEEMLGGGDYGQQSKFANQQYSEKAIYETILRESRNLDSNEYDKAKFDKTVKKYAEYGKLYLAQNPRVLKENPKLAQTEITDEKIKNSDPDVIKLMRYGFLLDQKLRNTNEQATSGAEKVLGHKKLQEVAHFLGGINFQDGELNNLLAGAALVIPLDDGTEDMTYEVHAGGATDLLDLKKTAMIVSFSAIDQEEGHEGTIGTALNPCMASIGFSGKYQAFENHHLRLNGGISQFGPIFAYSVGAGFGRDLNTYVAEREQETIKEFYDKKGDVFDRFRTAELEGGSQEELMSIAMEVPHLKELHDYFKTQEVDGEKISDTRINEVFLGRNGLVQELRDNVRNYAVEETDDFGWEVGGGVAVVEGLGLIPYAAVTLEFPTGTLVRYSIPDDMPGNVRFKLEESIQAQLKENNSPRNVIITETESGEVFYDTQTGAWKIKRSTEIPELAALNLDSAKKAERLTEYYKQYGIHFDTMSKHYPELAEKGYLEMNLNADFIGDADVEVHIDPSAKGLHLKSMKSFADNALDEDSTSIYDKSKISFALNANGAENLVITRREIIKPSGAPQVIITISDRTTSLEEIETKEKGYYHYKNGKLDLVQGAYNRLKSNERPNIGGEAREFDSPFFVNIDKATLDTSKKLKELEGKYPGGLQNRAELNTFVTSIKKHKNLTKFANLTTLRKVNWEGPQAKAAVKFMAEQFETKLGRKPNPAELQYVLERFTEETFIKLNKIHARNKPGHIKSVINLADNFVNSALNKYKHINNKFNKSEIKQIRTKIKTDFTTKLKNTDWGNLKMQTLASAGLEEHYLLSTAAAKHAGFKNRGFRFIDTNENSAIQIIANSVTQYNILSTDPNEKLVAKFVLQMSDPIPESNDIKDAKTLLESQLAVKMATLPIGLKNGDQINFLPIALGNEHASKVLDLIKNPDLAKEPGYKAAYEAFHALIKDMRTRQENGSTYEYKDPSGNLNIELTFPTEISSMLLERCGNTTFSSHQGIKVKLTNKTGKFLKAYSSKGFGYEATNELDTVKLTLGLSITPDADGDIPPPEDDGKPPTEPPDELIPPTGTDDPGGGPTPETPGSKTVAGGGGAIAPEQGPGGILPPAE